jgi:hypothetical protein
MCLAGMSFTALGGDSGVDKKISLICFLIEPVSIFIKMENTKDNKQSQRLSFVRPISKIKTKFKKNKSLQKRRRKSWLFCIVLTWLQVASCNANFLFLIMRRSLIDD